MPDYTSRYIFEARVRGFTRLNRELASTVASVNALKAAGINPAALQGSGGGGGGTSGYADHFLGRVGRYTEFMAVTGAYAATIGVIVAGTKAWGDATVNLSQQVGNLQVQLGRSKEEATALFAAVQRDAFTTSTAINEAIYASAAEKRLNLPGLSKSTQEASLVFPGLATQEAVNSFAAISIQFKVGMDTIKESLLDTYQASNLTAEEIFSMSDTWGPLADDLGFLNAAGDRTEGSLRKISGLMAGLSTVMGTTGDTTETLLRKFDRFYTDPKLQAVLGERGIRSTTISGDRIPFDTILSQIVETTKGGKDRQYLDKILDFFPNVLGQATSQQLTEMIRQWGRIQDIMGNATDDVEEWAGAVEAQTETISAAMIRLKESFSAAASATGADNLIYDFLDNIGKGLQAAGLRAQYSKSPYEASGLEIQRTRQMNVGVGLSEGVEWTAWRNDLERLMEKAAGDQSFVPGTYLDRRFNEIFKNFSLPQNISYEQMQAFFEQAIPDFVQSDYFKPDASGVIGAFDFQKFIEESDKYSYALAHMAGNTEEASESARTFVLATGQSTRAQEQMVPAVGNTTSQMAYLASMAYQAANALSTVTGLSDVTRVTLNEGVGVDEFIAQYQGQVAQERGLAAKNPNLAFDYEAGTVLLVDELGNIQGQMQAYTGIAENTGRVVNKINSDQLAAASQATADAKALQASIKAKFDSMIDAILKPSAVTGSDLFYNGPQGKYKDNWDEPFRRFGADINNLISGKAVEYPADLALFSQYLPPEVIDYAKGATQEVKTSIFQGALQQAQGPYYNLEFPMEAYNLDAIGAAADQWITGQTNRKDNLATITDFLNKTGRGAYSDKFLATVDTPPIVQMLTGGKTSDEISTEVGTYVPDVAAMYKSQFTAVSWTSIAGSAMQASVKNDPQPLKDAAKVMATVFKNEFSDSVAADILAKIFAALTKPP